MPHLPWLFCYEDRFGATDEGYKARLNDKLVTRVADANVACQPRFYGLELALPGRTGRLSQSQTIAAADKLRFRRFGWRSSV